MYYIGIDLHRYNLVVAGEDDSGAKIPSPKFLGTQQSDITQWHDSRGHVSLA